MKENLAQIPSKPSFVVIFNFISRFGLLFVTGSEISLMVSHGYLQLRNFVILFMFLQFAFVVKATDGTKQPTKIFNFIPAILQILILITMCYLKFEYTIQLFYPIIYAVAYSAGLIYMSKNTEINEWFKTCIAFYNFRP